MLSCKPQFLVIEAVSAKKLDLFRKVNNFSTVVELELCA